MPSWSAVTAAAPDLAALVERRFDAHGLGLLATLRKDGSPRISGIEPLFALGELWLGMMDGSRKVADIERDGRIALHSATSDKNVADGDAKVGGTAVRVADDETFQRFCAEFERRNGGVPDGPFPLFTVDVTDVSFLRPAGDHLDIDWWTEARGLGHTDRY